MVESIEKNHKTLKSARAKDGAIAIKVMGETSVQAGRHFVKTNQLVSFVREQVSVAIEGFNRLLEEPLQRRNGEG